jgi:dolichol-phosphate mannosyltransferase
VFVSTNGAGADGPPPAPRVDVSVIVPTYCEAANLAVLVPRLRQALASTGLASEVVVVDDNSPDETQEVCEALAADYPLHLHVRRHERGLSSAVLAGLRAAAGDTLVVMDADLSHPPEKVPELVAALQDPAVDFVIGSRYVPGASTDDRWGLYRWLNSRVATLLARPFTTAKDPMSGFFALRKSTFEKAAPLNPIGYKIGLELLVKCRCRNAKEIPIAFHDRLHGTSKLTVKEQVHYLRHLKRLFEFKAGRLARVTEFALVGLSGMLPDLSSFAVFQLWLPLGMARALSIWIAMTWNYVLNRRLTFSYARDQSPWRQYVLFCGSCLAGAVMNWSTSIGLCVLSPWFAQTPILAAFIGVAAGFAFNYYLSRSFVFRPLKK